jgi:TetR/AcrR family transcriptional repressor of nem operon
MSKGEQTREMILQRAVPVFNQRGYFGASLSDIMAATGLEKGGIYNHFASKDDLALHAFDYAVGLVEREFAEALQNKPNTVDRLLALVNVFRRLPQGSPVPGGCPVLNTAVEADDAHPLLRQRAQRAMDQWHAFMRRIVVRGIEKGEIRPEVNPDQVATLLIATLEGTVMLSKLYGDSEHMNRTVAFLTDYLETAVRCT